MKYLDIDKAITSKGIIIDNHQKHPYMVAKAKAQNIKSELSQRDQYMRAMNRATKKGGSNGVGVGY